MAANMVIDVSSLKRIFDDILFCLDRINDDPTLQSILLLFYTQTLLLIRSRIWPTEMSKGRVQNLQ